MAKKPETKAPGEVPAPENKALAQTEATKALAKPAEEKSLAEQLTALGASPGLVKRAVKAATNFALMDTPKIPRIKAASDGLILDESSDDDPTKEISGIIMFGAKYKAFYAEEYDADVKQPPDCYSHDGRAPEADVKARQNPVCKTCPKNQFGSAKTGKGKACRDIRRLFLLTSVEAGQETIMPMQLNVTPSSIKNWDDYLGKLVSYGFALEEVETKIVAKKKDKADKYVVLSFSKGKTYAEDNAEEKAVLANVQALRTLWLPHMERQHVGLDEIDDGDEGQPSAPPVQSGDY